MMTTIEKNIDKLLVKTDGQFQHEKIQRLRVEGEIATLRRYQGNFESIHEAFLQYREEGQDSTEEETLVEQQEKHYDNVPIK